MDSPRVYALNVHARYQSRGIRTHVAELFTAAGVLRVECARICASQNRPLSQDTLLVAIRMTDWLLVHLADRERLMAWLGRIATSKVSDQ